MRFDDRIATVLAQQAVRPDQIQAQWRQLIDLLAQRRAEPAGAEAERALERLREKRSEIPLEFRRRVAEGLAGLPVSPELVAFFAEDHPTVAAPLLASARLAAAEWVALIGRLGPTSRALLRHRRDLPEDAERALAAFGPADLVLEAAPDRERKAAETTPAPAAGGETQIRELVARIEAWQRRRETAPAPAVHPAADEEGEDQGPAERFHWETGPEGILLWVEGAPRGPLVGQTIASISGCGRFGVDGQAAGAFEKRAPFRDARFRVAGAGPASGDWRISGVPFFDPRRGAFLGYRGTARRPRADEVAGGGAGGLFGTEFPPDSLRQLIHELRTPLNAIAGFAEMIEGQHMGPAAEGDRGRAAEIMEQARRLLSAIDDLDTAARIETRRIDLGETGADAVALLCRLHDSYEAAARSLGSEIAVEIEAGLPRARVDEAAAERMFARLLAATIGLARPGETIAARMSRDARGGTPMLRLSVDRPAAIAGIGEPDLLDPGYSPEGDWPAAPALGLGFALRLVRNLAEAAGGALVVGERRFSLYLPAALPDGRGAERGGGGGSA